MITKDGVKWTDRQLGEEGEHLNSVVWAQDRFVAAGAGATYISSDGLKWERIPNANAPLSVAYGAMLGVFLLGVLTKKASSAGAAVGMASGLAAELYIWLFTPIPWTWYVPLGTAVTFTIGYIVSVMLGGPEIRKLEGPIRA